MNVFLLVFGQHWKCLAEINKAFGIQRSVDIILNLEYHQSVVFTPQDDLSSRYQL